VAGHIWPAGRYLPTPELNASINKERVPLLNPKQSKISPSNAEVVYNLRKMLVSTQRRELLSFETITKHTFW